MNPNNQSTKNGDDHEHAPDCQELPGDDSPTALHSPDELFRMLADTRRRYVLYYLVNNEGRGTFADLTDRLAAWETDLADDLPTEEVHRRVQTYLYHAALPELDDYGFVSFDPNTRKVKATDRLDCFTSFLDAARETEPDEYDRFCELLEQAESRDDQDEE